MKIFGREPTLWIAALQAALAFVVTFGFDWLTGEQAALWVTGLSALAGVWAAVRTRPVAPQAFTYLVTSAASLAGAYGLHWTPDRIGAANLVVLAVLAILTRGQVSPAGTEFQTGVLGAKPPQRSLI